MIAAVSVRSGISPRELTEESPEMLATLAAELSEGGGRR